MIVSGLAGCDPAAGGIRPPVRDSAADKVARMPTEPNILNVVAVYNPYTPWLWTEDKARARGIYIGGLYLIGPNWQGVFGDGVIKPRLYVMERQPDGTKAPVLVKEWSFGVEEVLPFRGKMRSKLGWGYGLPLDWGDLNLGGREIRVVVAFEGSDAQIVTSAKKDLIVPPGSS